MANWRDTGFGGAVMAAWALATVPLTVLGILLAVPVLGRRRAFFPGTGSCVLLPGLEVLDLVLVFPGGVDRVERSQIPAAARPGVDPSRIDPVLAGLQLSDHNKVIPDELLRLRRK